MICTPNVLVTCVECGNPLEVYGALEANSLGAKLAVYPTEKCCPKPTYSEAEFMFKVPLVGNGEPIPAQC